MEDDGKLLENHSPGLSSLDQNREKQSGPRESNEDGQSTWSTPTTLQPVLLSDEERRIRIELESEIEMGLEEELKQGICHLALRLHTLYQHQKERSKKNTFTELNIAIRMEGESNIEVHEIKRGNYDKLRTLSPGPALNQPSSRSLNWAKTLRSSSTLTLTNRKTGKTAETLRQSWRVTGSNCAALNIKKATCYRKNMRK
ncbi:hypothetical protein H6P81_010739 [Aristolochia fimbriata]|uniref:Uncharacterized protein n=1 Tax=Aristolochia fimbriata TaxID=158543 RepID=A0AAV7EQS7_ARIFI|nr:hypothetical protein H6P81_010739 [Aristolochia fimbriata]